MGLISEPILFEDIIGAKLPSTFRPLCGEDEVVISAAVTERLVLSFELSTSLSSSSPLDQSDSSSSLPP